MKKYLGVDWGTKRIGLALGEGEVKIASPWKIVSSAKDLINSVKEEEIDVVVVGVPYKLHGREANPQKEFSEFLKYLKENTEAEIKTVDERLSSKTADSFVGDKKTKASRDASSAMVILQQYLDSMPSEISSPLQGED